MGMSGTVSVDDLDAALASSSRSPLPESRKLLDSRAPGPILQEAFI
jgi:hypothetical protein